MLDGAARLDELVAKAASDGMPALGMTDHGNMYGVLDFYKECRDKGVKPIIGTEAYMAWDSRLERPARRGRVDDSGGDTEGGKKLYYHLTLLAETDVGYRNLIQLSSLAFMEGYYYKPRMDWELLEKYHEGLIATTSCLGGHVLQSLLNGDEKGAIEKASRLQDIFGKDNLFVEVFRRRAKDLNAWREAALTEAVEAARPKAPTVEAIVRAYLEPLLKGAHLSDPGWKNYYALVAYVNNTPGWGGRLMAESFDPLIRKFLDALRLAIPGIKDENLRMIKAE